MTSKTPIYLIKMNIPSHVLMLSYKLIDYSVNFEAALDYTRKNYISLIHLVISEDVIQNLYQERVITLNQKKELKRTEVENRMEYLLDEVITPSIKAKTGQKYISLIKVMQSSDNTSLNAVASELMRKTFDSI